MGELLQVATDRKSEGKHIYFQLSGHKTCIKLCAT